MTEENAGSGNLTFDEFEPGDPRRGPHTHETRAEAASFAGARGRWHARKPDVDWLAVRLQHGRGLKSREVARTFGVGMSTIDRRRMQEGWIRAMSEADRRRLSAVVWLAGVGRLQPDDGPGREALKAASEWRSHQAPAPLVWRENDRLGEPMDFSRLDFGDDA